MNTTNKTCDTESHGREEWTLSVCEFYAFSSHAVWINSVCFGSRCFCDSTLSQSCSFWNCLLTIRVEKWNVWTAFQFSFFAVMHLTHTRGEKKKSHLRWIWYAHVFRYYAHKRNISASDWNWLFFCSPPQTQNSLMDQGQFILNGSLSWDCLSKPFPL